MNLHPSRLTFSHHGRNQLDTQSFLAANLPTSTRSVYRQGVSEYAYVAW